MPKWTPKQEEAIYTKNKNILVSAAAGSGKTAVLVERIANLIIQEKKDISTMLICTFTNAAALEMKERISKRLEEEIDKKFSKRLKQQLELVPRAPIGTLHSFCISILKNYFQEVSLDPSFRIADESEKALWIDESLQEIMEEYYEKNEEDFIDLIESFSNNRSDKNIEDMVLNLYEFIQSQPEPFQWLDEKINDLSKNKSLDESIWILEIKKEIYIKLESAKNQIKKAIDKAKLDPNLKTYIEIFEQDLIILKNLYISMQDGLDEFFKNLFEVKFQRLTSIRKKDDLNEEIQIECKTLRDQMKKLIENLREDFSGMSLKFFEIQREKIYPRLIQLQKLVISLNEKYEEKKRENSALDFSDLEHYALKVLENDYIKGVYNNELEFIFFDEYQDSNRVQEAIIEKLSRKDNVFRVGDVKQSIYKFRMAEPSLFLEKYKSFQEENKYNKKIDLSFNFRSREEILEGINFIFEKIMTKEVAQMDYDENARLYSGTKFESLNKEAINWHVIDKEDKNDEESLDKVEIQAILASKLIKDLIGKQTYDSKEKKFRKIEYKDIVILLRSPKNSIQIYEDVLEKAEIPIFSDFTLDFFENIEIKIFLDLLKLIDNKMQDLPLLSVLNSYFGNFSLEELAKIRIQGKENEYFYEAFFEKSKDNDELGEKITKFLEKLKIYKSWLLRYSLEDFLYKLMHDSGYIYYVSALNKGDQRRENLKVLIEKSRQFEKTSLKGLFYFLRFLHKLIKKDAEISGSKFMQEAQNRVRIMSIHKSKGLEFPIVILPQMCKKFNFLDLYSEFVLHKDLGIGVKFVDWQKRYQMKSFLQMAIKSVLKREIIAEEMRILYVAMTRAVDQLHLISMKSNLNVSSLGTYEIQNAKSYSNWLDMTLEDDNIYFKKTNYSSSEINLQNNKEKESTKFKEKLVEKNVNINIDLHMKYDFIKSTKIPSKWTVSSIKSEYDSLEELRYKEEEIQKRPKYLKNSEKTSAERGTQIHLIMENLDFKNIFKKEDVLCQIKKMIEENIFEIDLIKKEDIKKIENFIESSIFKRMRKSNLLYKEWAFILKLKSSEILKEEISDDFVHIQGMIDACFLEDDEWVLIDYKSDFFLENQKKEVLNRYKKQIDFYKIALEKITKKKVKEKYIYLFEDSSENLL